MSKPTNKVLNLNTILSAILITLLGFIMFYDNAYAAVAIGTIAQTVTGSFVYLAKLITAAAYIAGLGFAVGAVMKFKQHKDNPTQIPIGTPVALMFISAALIFLPTIIGVTGATLFGSEGGTIGGPGGTVPGGS